LLRTLLAFAFIGFLAISPAYAKTVACKNPDRDISLFIAEASHPHEGTYWKTYATTKAQAKILIAAYKKDAIAQGESPLAEEPDTVYLSRLYANDEFQGTVVVFVKSGCFIAGVQINEEYLQKLLGRSA